MNEQERKTTKGDHWGACFHGEVWMKCRLCGRAYEAHFDEVDKESGEHFCPWCHGYGKES